MKIIFKTFGDKKQHSTILGHRSQDTIFPNRADNLHPNLLIIKGYVGIELTKRDLPRHWVTIIRCECVIDHNGSNSHIEVATHQPNTSENKYSHLGFSRECDLYIFHLLTPCR